MEEVRDNSREKFSSFDLIFDGNLLFEDLFYLLFSVFMIVV